MLSSIINACYTVRFSGQQVLNESSLSNVSQSNRNVKNYGAAPRRKAAAAKTAKPGHTVHLDRVLGFYISCFLAYAISLIAAFDASNT